MSGNSSLYRKGASFTERDGLRVPASGASLPCPGGGEAGVAAGEVYPDGPAAALFWGDFFTCKVRGWREFSQGLR